MNSSTYSDGTSNINFTSSSNTMTQTNLNTNIGVIVGGAIGGAVGLTAALYVIWKNMVSAQVDPSTTQTYWIQSP
jgi:hypothetical protein